MGDPGRSFSYNAAGRLSSATAGKRTHNYFYNAQGLRTRKEAGPDTTIYHYDLQGRLITEAYARGVWQRSYGGLNDLPLAQLEAVHGRFKEAVYYLHTDHLNTPRLATDNTGQILWRWEGTAFGDTPPNEDVDNDRKTVTINLRFPGQYYDAETGLHYNWYRYYDPRNGRYITSDPIGLRGGLNTYAYVGNNPLRFTDPTGLVLETWDPPGGGIGSDPLNWGWRWNNWYGNWCGPGGAGSTISGVDCACKKHDLTPFVLPIHASPTSKGGGPPAERRSPLQRLCDSKS